MCKKHDILDFINERLSEAVDAGVIERFTADSVWGTVKECHSPGQNNWERISPIIYCMGCRDGQYPCRRLRETAETWNDHPEYRDEWKL